MLFCQKSSPSRILAALALTCRKAIFLTKVQEVILSLAEHTPNISLASFVAPSADLIGQVSLAHKTSVWFQAVLRGDNEPITVGMGSNLQDGVVVHTDPGYPCRVGELCVIGHRAILHGCALGDRVLVGMGAIILNGVQVASDCIVGAGALVPENTVLETGYLYLGVPARKIRRLRPEEQSRIAIGAERYIERALHYRSNFAQHRTEFI